MPKPADHCPECGVFVRPENLANHLRKAHGKTEEAVRAVKARGPRRKAVGRATFPIWAVVLLALVTGGIGAAVYWNSLPPAPLTEMCVQHEGLGVHWHVQLNITILGASYAVPANIGIVSATCYRPLHTHNPDGVIHIELPSARAVHLSDFFAIWGQPFSQARILSYSADATHVIAFSVNGSPSSAYENLALQDGQRVLIAYQNR